jgi:hypothetical protein
MGVVNVVGSTFAVPQTQAFTESRPEIGVASTKALPRGCGMAMWR